MRAHLRACDENRGHGDALLAVSEARLPKQPWDLAQMEPAKRESISRPYNITFTGDAADLANIGAQTIFCQKALGRLTGNLTTTLQRPAARGTHRAGPRRAQRSGTEAAALWGANRTTR